MITGINVLDDFLLWTDNFSEPKKINIARSILGTGGTEYLIGGGNAGFWQNTNPVSGITTGGFGPGGSDRRLKKNISKIGKSLSGLKIYSFEYKDKSFGDGIFQGVMSDEVPSNAVVKHPAGYDMVDYTKLDVEFKNIS